MAITHHVKLGKKGEQIAAQFLKSKRISIRELNFRCSLGEIDIIAEQADVIIFIEVKTRSSENYGLPEEAVNYAKQQRLIQLAMHYLQKEGMEDRSCRFDVISILMKNNKPEKIEHIVDAFSA